MHFDLGEVGGGVVAQGRDGESAPYFFLAYAHTPEKSWVEKLFHDLCLEVLERTTLPVSGDVGFMDSSGISPGDEWPDEIAQALASCRVFVPLYSPRYFTRRECGLEWNAFSQRIIDHRARHPGCPSAIVPALWTPVEFKDLPEVAKRIHVNHAALGVEYAQEGFYTLIKNTLYRQEYVTAVQKLAQHIIRAAEAAQLRPCHVRDLGQPHDAFETASRTPADRRLNLIVAAPTVDRLPNGRDAHFYGASSNDWNPYHPLSHQAIVDYAAGVARLNSYDPRVLTFDQGYELIAGRDPSAGLGLLLLDVWAGADNEMASRLAELDAMDVDWVETMVPWNLGDAQTRDHADVLRGQLRKLLPNRLGEARPIAAINSARIGSLEEFRTKLPQVLEHAMRRYIVKAEAHPPAGYIPPRPRLSGADDPGADDPGADDPGLEVSVTRQEDTP